MRCLVTGGAGFIGSKLALYLEEKGHDVVVIDNFSTGHRDNIKNFNGKVLDVDVSKPFDVEGVFDAVFHEASVTDPRAPDDDETRRQNIEGFKNILNLSKEQNAKLIYASTASLYGNGPSPQKEDQEKEILSAYAESKLEMDDLAVKHFSDMHIVGLRYFNVFGQNELHKGRSASMVYHITKQIKKGERPKLFKMGEQKRDHIYVKDCVIANIKALDAPSGVYNVGTGIGTSFNDLVSDINKALQTNMEPEYIDMPYDPKTYQNNTQADTKKAKEELNFEAKYKLDDAIKEYVNLI